MMIGHEVQVKATGEIGKVEGFIQHGRGFELQATVRFEDGDLCPFSLSELEVTVQPELWVRYNGITNLFLTNGEIYQVIDRSKYNTVYLLHTPHETPGYMTWDTAHKHEVEIVPALTPTAAAISIHELLNPPLYADVNGVEDAVTGILQAQERNYRRIRQTRAKDRNRRAGGLLTEKG